MYQVLAHLYDWAGAEEFARTVLTRIQPEFDQAGVLEGARVLDLACGTGTLTLELAKRGYEVVGLDISGPMLAIAAEKNAQRSRPIQDIQWVQGDMRHFLLHPPFDAVVCMYDSLNHLLSEADLRECLIAIHENLKPGGLLLFDMNTRANYDTFWQGKDIYEGPNYRLTTQTRFIPETGRAQVDYLAEEHTENGLLSREESVTEQYFDEMQVEDLLKATGFTKVELETFNPFADEELPASLPLKTFWRCTRKA